MKKIIVLITLALLGCKKETKEPEPTPEPTPAKVLEKQKVTVMVQNGCTTYTVALTLKYGNKDTIVSNKSFFAFFEDSIAADKIVIGTQASATCMTRTISVSVNGGVATNYTTMINPITHTLQ